MKILFLATHLLAVGLGFLIFRSSGEDAPLSDEPAVQASTRARLPDLPRDANPIAIANTEDFRRAADLYFSDGEMRGDFGALIREWIKNDPEAAILAVAKHFDYTSADDFLRNLQVASGSRIAPALVKHYDEFEFVKKGTVMDTMGWAIGELANEDFDAALQLLNSLPIPTNELPFGAITDRMNVESFLKLFSNLPALSKSLQIGESENFWEESIGRAWRVLSPDEFASIYEQVDHPEGLKHLASNSLREATRFEEYGAFIETYESLPASKKTHVLGEFQKFLENASEATIEGFREAGGEVPELRNLLWSESDE